MIITQYIENLNQRYQLGNAIDVQQLLDIGKEGENEEKIYNTELV